MNVDLDTLNEKQKQEKRQSVHDQLEALADVSRECSADNVLSLWKHEVDHHKVQEETGKQWVDM